MSFETDIIAKYAPAIGGRLYWDSTPRSWGVDDMQTPFCIMQTVGGESPRYIDNKVHEFLKERVQFFVWGANRVAVSNAMRTLANAIAVSSTAEWVTIVSGGPSGDWNEVLKLRGQRQDFEFWYKNPLYVP